MRYTMKRINSIIRTAVVSFFIVTLFITLLQAETPKASIKLGTMNMKTYLIGPDDPNPPLFDPKVYPYPMKTEITRNSIDSAHKIVTLENEFIKVMVMPEIGGRMLGALDKTNNNVDFIYYNHVVKPALIALRGAWLSGGMEWNFPTLGHTTTTISPMHYQIKENADGSVTCSVGETEFVRRMRWVISLTVYPDKSYIKIVNRLYNPTPTHNNAYYWQNVAFHATDDVQVIFPPTNYTKSFGDYRIYNWPFHKGVDVSWFKNTPEAEDYFCGIPGDYNGAYYHDKEYGTVHYANKFDCPGRKFFTWGTSDAGDIWVDILTDTDGQYIEIQNGRLPTQGDTWIFEPFMVEEWVDYWYPIKNMGNFVKANDIAAVNCEQQENGILAAVNVTQPMKDLKIVVKGDGKEIFTALIPELCPKGSFRHLIQTPVKPSTPELILYAADGTEIIHYTKLVVDTPIPDPAVDIEPNDSMSAQEIYELGYKKEKRWDPYGAAELYQWALKKDSRLTSALHRLGIYYYKTAQFTKALECLDKALAINVDLLDSRYYRALTYLQMEKMEQAEEDFWKVSRRRPYEAPAFFLLSRISLLRHNLNEAENLIERSLASGPNNYKAIALQVAVLRHLGKYEKSEILLNCLLEKDPLNALARSESYYYYLTTGSTRKAEEAQKDLIKFLYRGAQDYLEVAIDYAENGFYDEALGILEFGIKNAQGKNIDPMLYYYSGYYSKLNGAVDKVTVFYSLGAEQSPEYVFPNRLESAAVLSDVITHSEKDWKAHYYSGNFLVAKDRWREGLDEYLKAEQIGSTFSVLFRNIGQVYREKVRDLKKAAVYYEKATAMNNKDYRYYGDLDEIYRGLGLTEKRENLFKSMPQDVKSNFNILLKLALFDAELGRYDEAVQILENNTFLPWEGWLGARRAYHYAHYGRGIERFVKGQYEQALEDFNAVEVFPRNLGAGRRQDEVFPRENYYAGLCYEKMGQELKAKEQFKKVSNFLVNQFSEDNCFRAFALNKYNSVQGQEILRSLALQAEEKIIKEKSNDMLYYIASLAYSGLGQQDKAVQYLNRCLELDSHNFAAKVFLKQVSM